MTVNGPKETHESTLPTRSIVIDHRSTMQTIAADVQRACGTAEPEADTYVVVDRRPFQDIIPGLANVDADEPTILGEGDYSLEPDPPLSMEERVAALEADRQLLMRIVHILAGKHGEIADLLADDIWNEMPEIVPMQRPSSRKKYSPAAQDASKAILEKIRAVKQKRLPIPKEHDEGISLEPDRDSAFELRLDDHVPSDDEDCEFELTLDDSGSLEDDDPPKKGA